MRYLLDTSVLSDFARGEASTLARPKATPPGQVAVSSVTVMEVEFGLALNPQRARRPAPVMNALLGTLNMVSYEAADARGDGQ